MSKLNKLMIIAGEPSGDLHGGHLAKALFATNSDLVIAGIGGGEMTGAGVDVFFDMKEIAVVGIVEVIFHFDKIKKAFNLVKDRILAKQYDAIVLVDFPDFNLRLAKIAHDNGLPVFYYISPQLWAWRKGRVKQIARNVDKMLVILPFEKEFYDKYDVDCTFVGHPLLDESEDSPENQKFLSTQNSPLIALFPGSRKSEISRLLAPMLGSVAIIKKEFPTASFVLSLAESLDESLIGDVLKEYADQFKKENVTINVLKGCPQTILEQADLAIVASGTTTLQAALADTPMVVIYKLFSLTYFIGSLLIDIKHIALANLVAGKRVVPELIQNDATSEKIALEVSDIITKTSTTIKKELKVVRDRLGKSGCSEKSASIIFDFFKILPVKK